MSIADRLLGEPGRRYLAVWTVVLLFSGQGFRNLLGLAGYTVLTLLTLLAVCRAYWVPLRQLRPPVLLSAFVGLAALSIIWSATRAVSTLAVVVLLATTLVALQFVRSMSARGFLRVLHRGLQVSIGIGLVFEIVVAFLIGRRVFPLFSDLTDIADLEARHRHNSWSDNLLLDGGPIQGFVGNRNPFAAMALLALITAVICAMEGAIRRLDALITVIMSSAVLLLTMSATITVSLLYLAVVAVMALTIRALPERKKKALSWSALAVSAALGVVIMKYRELIFAMMDRSSDMTNRTVVWKAVIETAEPRPEGWGYVSYWPVWESPYRELMEASGRITAHAHNALLDVWLQLGFIGAAIFIGILFLTFGSSWRLIERARRGDTFIPLGWALLTVALVLESLTESRLLVEGHWFLLVALFCSAPQVFALTVVDPQLVRTGVSHPAVTLADRPKVSSRQRPQ